MEMLPGCSKLLGTLGGGPQTRVNETHLDQRLVNGLFHLLIDGVKGLSAFSVQAHKFYLVKSSQCSAVPDRFSCFFW